MEGLGTTLDVILVHGQLREGDTIVVCGLNGPITTTGTQFTCFTSTSTKVQILTREELLQSAPSSRRTL